MTAMAMNTEPPRRYSCDTADGSPMRRRSHSDSSSKAWNRMSRNSAARLNSTSSMSWFWYVKPMFATSTIPTSTIAFSGRRWPNVV